MTEDDRKKLGELIAAQRKRHYGTKSAAYKEASVNAATWDRAEAGQTVREDRLQAIVRLLWPATQGDPQQALTRATNEWTKWEDQSLLEHGEMPTDRIASWAAENFERINQTIAEMSDAIEALTRKVGGDDGTTTTTQKNEIAERRARAAELSDSDDTLVPAADDVITDVDEELGGSDERG